MPNKLIPVGFKGLNFGAPAAERDTSQGLKNYFVESEAFRRVQAREKYIILGNRGSGKSAIFTIWRSANVKWAHS
jgi:ABC-type lipoprotein export system ATPase subunit